MIPHIRYSCGCAWLVDRGKLYQVLFCPTCPIQMKLPWLEDTI